MLPLPRVAVGAVQPGTEFGPILWALMEVLRERGLQVQSFLSRACFAQYHGVAGATGLSPRHLDSWLMSPEVCREIFIHAAQSCDLAVVQGEFAPEVAADSGVGGRLETLCEWLDLPRLVVLDVSRLQPCHLRRRPEQVDALLLDRVGDGHHLARWTTDLEALWGVPVLGALEELPALRAEIDAIPSGTRPPRELCRELAGHFGRHLRVERLLKLAFRRGLAAAPRRLFASEPVASGVVVAVAYDEAMNCYFPDVLDLLELRGATIIDFSPLRDERLPKGANVVYLGCGHPERFSDELSQNHCMKLALRNHLRNGGRIYAEGGGMAYLCQHVEAADGELRRMVGIFPAIARPNPSAGPPTPVEITLDRATWLGHRGARLRGYRNHNWKLEPAGPLTGCILEAGQQHVLVKSCGAIGSQLHLHFAVDPALLPNFVQPQFPHPDPADPWTVAT